MDFKGLRRRVINKELDIKDLDKYEDDFISYASKIIKGNKYDLEELENFLILTLDYYVFNKTGNVLISDRDYDLCMKEYVSNDKELIIIPDSLLGGTKWKFDKHKVPGLVGSLDKIYTYEELKGYLLNNQIDKSIFNCILAPKFDGVSASIEVDSHLNIVKALTRYNGYEGQDITALVRKASNSNKVFTLPGYYKCELVISNDNFNRLIEENKYANRRSATTGIINTPKNIQYGWAITIIPLLYYNENRNEVRYIPLDGREYSFYTTRDCMDAIERLMEKFKNKKYPYRVDGIVIFPVYEGQAFDRADFLSNAIAYKINTSEALTKVKYGYMSVGRLGNATPMLKVEPVEVNETIVEDASLSSYNKFLSYNLHEGEDVIVYSAGDVIPQVKMPQLRTNFYNDEPLKIKKICPYCKTKLTRIGTEYKCINRDCSRVICGRISNFIVKLGVENYSDATIELLYKRGILNSIEDLFRMDAHDIAEIPGFGMKSAKDIIDQIDLMSRKPIPVSTLFGALGIENISEKKCRRIFEGISLKKILNKSRSKVIDKLVEADGIGYNTAKTFMDFVEDNKDTIEYLLARMNITEDVRYKGNVVFTGFTNKEWEDKFRSIGYDIGSSVTNQTVAVIAATADRSSGKCKRAIQKGIEITDLIDINRVYKDLLRNE